MVSNHVVIFKSKNFQLPVSAGCAVVPRVQNKKNKRDLMSTVIYSFYLSFNSISVLCLAIAFMDGIETESSFFVLKNECYPG